MEFKVKSVAEISAMSNEDLMAYKQAESKYFEAKFAEMEKANELANEQSKKLEEQAEILKKQGEVIAELKKGGSKSEAKKSLKEVVEVATKNYTAGKEGSKVFEIDTKAVTIDDTAEYFGDRLVGVSKIPVRTPMIADLFAVRPVPNGSGAKIKYIEQTVVIRNADNVAFCSTMPESEISFDTVEEPVKKIGDSIIVCKDDLEDYDFLQSEINQLMSENIPLKLDQQLLLGTGTGLEMNSIDSVAQLWSVGVGSPIASWSANVAFANIFDLMRSAIYQIRLSMQTDSRFNPNTILINPATMGLLKSTKDDNGQPFIPYFMVGGNIVIDGATVKESILVPENEMYVFDSTKGTIHVSRNLTIEFATQHANNFMEDKVAYKATMKGQFIVRNQYKNAFLKVTDIDAAIVAITKP